MEVALFDLLVLPPVVVSTHAKNLGVVFRFVVSKQLVDVSTHVIFR